jgi:hypothetical protein
MPQASKSSALSSVLDFLFGKRLTEEETRALLTARPPRWWDAVYRIVSTLLILALGVWGLGALGWLPFESERFTLVWLMVINGLFLSWSLARDEVEKHYRRKAGLVVTE